MRKVWINKDDFELFHQDINPVEFEFFRSHMGTFKRMWHEQTREFWRLFVRTFDKFLWDYGILRDFPMTVEETHTYIDEIVSYIKVQFVDGKVSTAKALIMDCVVVTQNRHCIVLLDKGNYAQNPFFAKETREVFRKLFGAPDEHRTYLKLLCGLQVYIKFAGAVVVTLRRWMDSTEIDDDDERSRVDYMSQLEQLIVGQRDKVKLRRWGENKIKRLIKDLEPPSSKDSLSEEEARKRKKKKKKTKSPTGSSTELQPYKHVDTPTTNKQVDTPTMSKDVDTPTGNRQADTASEIEQIDPPETSKDVDLPGTSKDVDLPGTSQDVDLPGTSQDVDLPGTSQDVDLPGTSQNVDLPGTSQDVGTPRTSQDVDTPTMSQDVDTPTETKQIETILPGTSKDVDTPTGNRQADTASEIEQIDPPETSKDVDLPGTSKDVDLPGTSQNVDLPRTSQDVGMPGTSQDVGTPRTSQDVDTPTMSQDVDTPTETKQIDTSTMSKDMDRNRTGEDTPTSHPSNLPEPSAEVSTATSSETVAIEESCTKCEETRSHDSPSGRGLGGTTPSEGSSTSTDSLTESSVCMESSEMTSDLQDNYSSDTGSGKVTGEQEGTHSPSNQIAEEQLSSTDRKNGHVTDEDGGSNDHVTSEVKECNDHVISKDGKGRMENECADEVDSKLESEGSMNSGHVTTGDVDGGSHVTFNKDEPSSHKTGPPVDKPGADDITSDPNGLSAQDSKPVVSSEEVTKTTLREEGVAGDTSVRSEGVGGRKKLHVCHYCGQEETVAKNFKRCQKCRGRPNPCYYCSKECQVKHWKTHKLDHRSEPNVTG